jgi:tetratricopeptide (TPR) repeat protein
VDGVPSADVYGSLAPKVGHAVHMPGHTYVHVDRWDDAAKAFEGSAEVDRAYIRDNKETTDHAAGPYGHNVHFLANVYGYQGRYRDGLRVSQELLDVALQKGEEKSRAGFEGRLARLRILTRFEKWSEILDGKSLPDAGNYEVFTAWRHYATALAQLGKGDVTATRATLDSLEREIAWMKDRLAKVKDAPQIGRQRQQLRALGVAPIELKARLAARAGNTDEALKLVRDAIEEEIKLGYSEPPLYPQPMEEVAGKLALELKRWQDAEAFFRAALERDPGSGRAYFGLMHAQQKLDKQADAKETYARFVKAWKQADEDLPKMRAAKEQAALYRVASHTK